MQGSRLLAQAAGRVATVTLVTDPPWVWEYTLPYFATAAQLVVLPATMTMVHSPESTYHTPYTSPEQSSEDHSQFALQFPHAPQDLDLSAATLKQARERRRQSTLGSPPLSSPTTSDDSSQASTSDPSTVCSSVSAVSGFPAGGRASQSSSLPRPSVPYAQFLPATIITRPSQARYPRPPSLGPPSPLDRSRRSAGVHPELICDSSPDYHRLSVQLPLTICPSHIQISGYTCERLVVSADAWHLNADNSHYEWVVRFRPRDIEPNSIHATLNPDNILTVDIRRRRRPIPMYPSAVPPEPESPGVRIDPLF